MGAITLADLLGVPLWVLAGLLVLMALGMFWPQKKLERRIAGEERA